MRWGGGVDKCCKGARGDFWGDESLSIPPLWHSYVCIFQNSLNFTIKRINVTEFKLYLNRKNNRKKYTGKSQEGDQTNLQEGQKILL